MKPITFEQWLSENSDVQICPTCNYPFSGASCPNPACAANPDIPADVKALQKEKADKERAERLERERVNRIRRNMTMNKRIPPS
jgi:hypothetical protein